MPALLEICCDSVAAALAAEAGGAGRLELCAGLVDGGVTPSIGMVKRVCAAVHIPVNVLIRPRSGDFVFSESEVEVMCDDIAAVGEAGAAGVVVGALTPDGDFDPITMQRLVTAAADLTITFHRAIDMSRSPLDVLAGCAACGIDRVLSSGGANTAVDGIGLLTRLVTAAAGSGVTVVAGGGVSEANIALLVETAGLTEIHGSFRSPNDCKTTFRKAGVFMGASKVNDDTSEFVLKSVDASRVAAACKALEVLASRK